MSTRPSACFISTTSGDKRKAYSATLHLPKAPVPLKHKRPADVDAALREKTSSELYRRQWAINPGATFVLHDGPPYANGHLHMGHALNKTLKDIINRYQVVRGRRVQYVPGWDCHGLPIEHKALAALGRDHLKLDPLNVRSTARNYALEAIEIQKEEMRSLGIMADWDAEKGVYRTLDHDFEIRQLRQFRDMVAKGYISHRLKPVYYSPSSRTALAEAELVYQERVSESVYVQFKVALEDMSLKLRDVARSQASAPLSLVVWTTTPWSLAGNMGVAVGEDIIYAVCLREGQLLVVAEERLEALQAVLPGLKPIDHLTGSALAGTRYTHTFHPVQSDTRPAVFVSTHVTSTSGTGLVHSAPAHGHEDYESFASAGILPSTLRCPIDAEGRFTRDVADWAPGATRLVGLEALGTGTAEMIDVLRTEGVLLAQETISHRYPCDWKTKQPVLVCATPQWFADVDAIKPKAQSALEQVEFYPATGKTRLLATVLSRSEWCISRQRSWGVPIPALHDDTGPILSVDTLDHIIKVLDAKGTDHWWSGPVDEFVPPSLAGRRLTKGTDTLDVWFDSGSSWTLLSERTPLADVYLEGSDQHRGWFQSSLLTRLSVAPHAPYKTVITHGFVMDEKGDKMSKSAGNGFSPMDIVHGMKDQPGLGADALRVWAAGVDYSRDVSIGPTSIAHAAESLRKLRSTLRFLLANADASERGTPSIVDRHVLRELEELKAVALDGYDRFAFSRVIQSISAFASGVLSTFYFNVIKDTLYCASLTDEGRQAIAATLHQVLCDLLKMVAPIAPYLAEELYAHVGQQPSVFLDHWLDESAQELAAEEEDTGVMRDLLTIRTEVMAMVERTRNDKNIRSAAETQLIVQADRVLVQHHDILAPLFGVASVKFDETPSSPACLASSSVATERGQVDLAYSAAGLKHDLFTSHSATPFPPAVTPRAGPLGTDVTSNTMSSAFFLVPDALRLITFFFRLCAFIVASPFVLCIVLDVIAYARTETPADSDAEDSPLADVLAASPLDDPPHTGMPSPAPSITRDTLSPVKLLHMPRASHDPCGLALQLGRPPGDCWMIGGFRKRPSTHTTAGRTFMDGMRATKRTTVTDVAPALKLATITSACLLFVEQHKILSDPYLQPAIARAAAIAPVAAPRIHDSYILEHAIDAGRPMERQRVSARSKRGVRSGRAMRRWLPAFATFCQPVVARSDFHLIDYVPYQRRKVVDVLPPLKNARLGSKRSYIATPKIIGAGLRGRWATLACGVVRVWIFKAKDYILTAFWQSVAAAQAAIRDDPLPVFAARD
ncbi:isoleucine-tRNA ligase [Cryptotrichosporon argae]